MTQRVERRRALALCLGLFLAAVASATQGDIEARIADAELLNVTAPLEESEAALAALASELDTATPRQRARVTILRARNLAITGDYDGAIDLLAPVRAESGDADIRLAAYRISANSALNQNDFEQGYRFLREGLDILPAVDAVEPKVLLLAVANWFFSGAGESERALELSQRALQLARTSGDQRLICVALGEVSVAQASGGLDEDQFGTLQQALPACEAAGDPIMVGAYRMALGHVIVDRGDLAAGRAAIEQGIEELRAASYRDGLYTGRIYLAEAMLAGGDTQGAEAEVLPLVSDLQGLEYWENLADVHRLLAEIAASRGDFRSALEHTQAASVADDELTDNRRSMRVAYLQAEFDIQAKQQQITLLQQQNALLGLQEQTGRQRTYIAIGGLSAAAVIVALLLMLLVRSRSDRHRLLWLSQRDGLTGLRNHTSFFREANEALRASREGGQPFTLVVSDIDHFKAINDRFGHPVGDAVLRRIGAVLREVLEPIGVVGRIGGEEFAMALPGMRPERAMELISELRERLAPVRDGGDEVTVTLSHGLSEIGEDRTVEIMRLFADQALYAAKQRGRDRAVDASEVCTEESVLATLNRRADDQR